MERPWDSLIPEAEKVVYRAAGYGKRGTWGERPALMIVDVNYNFTGDRPEPILESIKRFRNSCGEIAWQTIPKIVALLDAARGHGVPVFYSTSGYRPDALGVGSWGQKNTRATTPSEESLQFGAEIVKEIAPLPDEVVVRKDKPSAFFGTALVSHLTARKVDTVIIAGTTTSGCVRATAVDAFSYNYRVVVVEDCVFDRGDTPHRLNLFDLESKYADVVPAKEVVAYFERGGRA
ncbi:MAG: isochorismatase family protein [Dehalococcoidia bacterium]|nr:isochorismatase family protein [Dehalococcoidia bacterium]